MKPYILEQTNWKQVKYEKYQVAVLPWGATEPHNYHMPYGTDSLETAKIAEEAAEKAWKKGVKIMVLPTIPFGVQNPGQINLPFCLHTKPSTQTLIFKDIVEALYKQGIRKLVLMNGHGGNDFKPMIREIQPQFPEMLISWLNGSKFSICRNILKKMVTTLERWKPVLFCTTFHIWFCLWKKPVTVMQNCRY
jgi:creatinine amidohydrolase